MGAIYWQINDCWPVISWASIDSCGRWKALQYYAKRFFAPILLSCEETSMMTEEININGENEIFTPAVRFNVSNETMDDHELWVQWELNKKDGTVIRQEEQLLRVDALSTCWMEKIELKEADWYNHYVTYRLFENGSCLGESSVLFTMPKYFKFDDPKLKVWVEADEIKVEASSFAKCVEIQNQDEDLILSDNYFDMKPGIHTVKILRGEPKELRVRSVYDIR